MLNTAIFIGRVTKKPKLNKPEDENKKTYCCFQLAVKRNNGETDYPEFVCYSHLAEFFCQYVHKGDLICVASDYHSHFFNNTKHHEFVVSKIELLGNPQKGGDDIVIPQ